VALILRVPTLVRSGGRSVIGFVTSGSVEPRDLLIGAWPTRSTEVDRSLAGAGGSPRSCVNVHTGQGSVNGATMRMMNSAARNFLIAKDAYFTCGPQILPLGRHCPWGMPPTIAARLIAWLLRPSLAMLHDDGPVILTATGFVLSSLSTLLMA